MDGGCESAYNKALWESTFLLEDGFCMGVCEEVDDPTCGRQSFCSAGDLPG
jgi:hypothetical protein